MERLLAHIYSTIKKHGMARPGQKVCVAISGGPDSTALLAILSSLAPRLEIEIKACHFDHAYRGDSAEDCRQAIDTAQKLSIPIITERNQNKKPASGLQLIARDLRYRFFAKLLENRYADLIATGHTMDDSVETSIMWMIRGTGPDAFGGIPPVREKYIRPLIETRKSELMAWLNAEGMGYKIDPTNLTLDYLRNKIRSGIIPAMEKEAPHAVEAISRLTRLIKGQSEVLDGIAAKQMSRLATSSKGGDISYDFNAIAKEPEAIRLAIYRRAAKKSGIDLASLTLEHFDSIDRLVTLGSLGKAVHLPGGYEARVDHGGLTIRQRGEDEPIADILFAPSIKISIGDGVLSVSTGGNYQSERADVDINMIPADAVFRGRKPGDYLRLKNMEGRKSFKKFLIDRKTPSGNRDRIILLAVGNEVLWANGLFLAPSIAATPNTTDRATIRFDEQE